MTDLATMTDLALLLRTPQDDPRAALALRRASDRFADDVGWPVAQTIDDQLLLSGHGGTRLSLPALNVTAAAVSIDGEPAINASTTPDGIVLNPRLGILYRAAGWPVGFANIAITYTHGWPEGEIPGGISDAVLEQAVHNAASLGVFSQENRGSLSGSYSPGALGGTTQRWEEAVAKYRPGGSTT